MSAFATRLRVRWLCGSSSAAIRTSSADDGAHALEQIALAIVVALRDHGAVQAENDGVDRQGGAQLAEDFVAQFLIGLALQQPAGLRPGRRALDQREALLGRAPAQRPPSATSTASASADAGPAAA